jgi:hypothetical protein
MSVTNLIDRPVDEYYEEEPLGLSRYATALSDFIKDCETPITVGIQGDWGVGKTSLLNMVKGKLEDSKYYKDRVYPVIYFNTWKYAQLDQEDHLTVAMLHDITREIKELSSSAAVQEKAGDILKKVGGIALSLGNQVVRSQTGVDIQGGVKSAQNNGEATPAFLQVMELMVEYKSQFEDLVRAYMEDKDDRSRLVIMIDDLDRIRPARALDLLSSIKNFLDVPYCVFVLAVDYSVIQRGVKEKLGAAEQKQHGKSYFDKIIQVPFNMPVSSYHVDRYIMSLLGWEQSGRNGEYKRNEAYKASSNGNDSPPIYFYHHKTIEEDGAKEIENFARLTVGKNPRSIKRAVNYFSLLKRVFDENGGVEKAKMRSVPGDKRWQSLYLQLLFGLSCFQLSYPEIFELFVQNPTPSRLLELSKRNKLDELPQISKIAQRVNDIEEVKSDISGFFDLLRSILDTNDDWEIKAKEFQPVWDVIKYANLAGNSLGSEEDTWEEIRSMVEGHAAEAKASDGEMAQLSECVRLLEESAWSNPLHLRATSKATKFKDLLWDGSPVGSITSGKVDPLQFHVVAETFESFADQLSEEARQYVENVGESHLGEGIVRIHLRKLRESNRAPELLEEYLRVVLSSLQDAK